MGCNCKSNKKIDDYLVNDSDNKTKVGFGSYTLKTLAFLLLLIALPIINIVIVWFMFRTVVLNKEVSITPLLTTIGKKFQDKEDDEDVNIDELTEDDVIMVDVEDITNKKY